MDSVDYSKKLKELLIKERDEDYRLFREQFLKASFEERRKNGLTWYPVNLINEEPAYGDYVQANLERTIHLNEPHQFSAGKNVILFSNKNNQIKEIKGTIKYVQKNSIAIILQVDDLPEWVYEGKLGINLQFDELSYDQMEKAIETVIQAKDNRIHELREIFNGERESKFDETDDNILIPGLNLSQNKAIRKVIAAKDVAVIHGPPGTGKTTTLIHAIRLTLQKEKQVLVCAPTNTAVDLLTERLTDQGVKVLRIGHPARISEALINSTLDGSIQNHVHFKEIKLLKKNAEEYFRMASKYKRSFGKEEREQR
ncbi:MAG: AAA domain-containing protein, partial [Bacteroidota bacterium]